MTQRQDYNMVRASDLDVPVRVARRIDGTVIDLTGATVVWRVGPANRSATSVEMGIGSGVTIVDLTAGTYTRRLVASNSVGLRRGNYRQTVKVTETDGRVTLVEQGFINIEKDLP